MGFASLAAWTYAVTNRRLIGKEMSDAEALAVRRRIMTEPMTAVFTTPCAFIGPMIWELAWLFYPLLYRHFRSKSQNRVR
jgi:hypothetical protein